MRSFWAKPYPNDPINRLFYIAIHYKSDPIQKKCEKSVTNHLNGPLPSALRHCSGGLEDVEADWGGGGVVEMTPYVTWGGGVSKKCTIKCHVLFEWTLTICSEALQWWFGRRRSRFGGCLFWLFLHVESFTVPRKFIDGHACFQSYFAYSVAIYVHCQNVTLELVQYEIRLIMEELRVKTRLV